jgi:hypothetical protein
MSDSSRSALTIARCRCVRCQAIVIERLATEFHALLMVLTEKKVASLDEIRARERHLDLASEVARTQKIADVTRDLETLDAELDEQGPTERTRIEPA